MELSHEREVVGNQGFSWNVLMKVILGKCARIVLKYLVQLPGAWSQIFVANMHSTSSFHSQLAKLRIHHPTTIEQSAQLDNQAKAVLTSDKFLDNLHMLVQAVTVASNITLNSIFS